MRVWLNVCRVGDKVLRSFFLFHSLSGIEVFGAKSDFITSLFKRIENPSGRSLRQKAASPPPPPIKAKLIAPPLLLPLRERGELSSSKEELEGTNLERARASPPRVGSKFSRRFSLRRPRQYARQYFRIKTNPNGG